MALNDVMLAIGFAILIVVFLVIREFWTWYWKINDGLRLLKGIRQELAAANQQLARLNTFTGTARSEVLPPPEWLARSDTS